MLQRNDVLSVLQYVEHHPNYEKAKEWMEKNLSDDLLELYLGDKGSVLIHAVLPGSC